MNWDDLRYVLALSDAGTLAEAARALGVDHTTVGRRILAAEAALGLRLFTRSQRGYLPTEEAQRLLSSMRSVESAVLQVQRSAHATDERIEGYVRITAPETFGVAYLAPRLARFGAQHPGLTLELLPAGKVLDLSRREAEIALRRVRTRHQSLVVRRAATIRYGLYAARRYLEQHPIGRHRDLRGHAILTSAPDDGAVDQVWVAKLTRGRSPRFVSTFSLALMEAAKAGAGVAVLPRYLGDEEPALRLVAMPDAPSESLWLTVHRDLRGAPRVRAVLDFLVQQLREDAGLLTGTD